MINECIRHIQFRDAPMPKYWPMPIPQNLPWSYRSQYVVVINSYNLVSRLLFYCHKDQLQYILIFFRKKRTTKIKIFLENIPIR